MIAVISIIWVIFSVPQGFKEFRKTAFSFRTISLIYLISAIIGGIAAWCTYITVGLVSTLFSVANVMFYPLAGLVISKLWLHEKISKNSKIDIIVITFGWLILLFPTLLNTNILNSNFIVCILGLITGVCWGIEGCLASHATDFSDTVIGVSVRFCFESFFWIIIYLIISIINPDGLVRSYMKILLNDTTSMSMLFIIALCLTFNYFSWYKAFTLIGVFITYQSKTDETAVLRSVNTSIHVSKIKFYQNTVQFPLKLRALITIGQRECIWDFEIARILSEEINSERKRISNRFLIRSLLIEAQAAGLITIIEQAVDEGHFQKGKLLCKYQLTEFGYERLEKCGLLNKKHDM